MSDANEDETLVDINTVIDPGVDSPDAAETPTLTEDEPDTETFDSETENTYIALEPAEHTEKNLQTKSKTICSPTRILKSAQSPGRTLSPKGGPLPHP